MLLSTKKKSNDHYFSNKSYLSDQNIEKKHFLLTRIEYVTLIILLIEISVGRVDGISTAI